MEIHVYWYLGIRRIRGTMMPNDSSLDNDQGKWPMTWDIAVLLLIVLNWYWRAFYSKSSLHNENIFCMLKFSWCTKRTKTIRLYRLLPEVLFDWVFRSLTSLYGCKKNYKAFIIICKNLTRTIWLIKKHRKLQGIVDFEQFCNHGHTLSKRLRTFLNWNYSFCICGKSHLRTWSVILQF